LSQRGVTGVPGEFKADLFRLGQGYGRQCRLMAAPLSPMAPAIKPLERGEAIWALTEMDPADSPAMVTFSGSPPKAAMFFRTHFSPAF